MDIAQLGIAVDSRQVRTATGDLNRFAASARTVPGPLGAIVSRMGVVALGAGAAATAIAGMSIAVGSNAVSAFQQLELEQSTYNGVLRATGFAAGRTAEDIENLASTIRRTTLATEGQVRSASAIMLTFRSVTGEAFDEALTLSQDLAAVGFGSITSAATMMGKALEDPLTGLTALRRVGVSFNATQKQQIKQFLETGQAARAQQVILEGVRKQVGGAGAAQGATLSGAWNQLGEATNNWLERTGETIAKAIGIGDAIRGIASAIDAVNKRAEEAAAPQARLAAAESALAIREGAGRNMGVRRGSGSAINQQIEEQRRRVEELRVEVRATQMDIDDAYESVARNAAQAAQEQFTNAIDGTLSKLREQNAELRRGALANELYHAKRDAVRNQNGELSEAQSRQIDSLVTQNFYLKNGAALMTPRLTMPGALKPVPVKDEKNDSDHHRKAA